ncbi:MAG: XRE family transcriptional regulator [Actinomycetota bacterium]
MDSGGNIEHVVRTRLRALRQSLDLSLDELADRTNVSASTISRIETGKRSISLDVLVPLAAALQIDLDSLFETSHDEDVVIRPTPQHGMGHTTWLLSRPTSDAMLLRMHIEPQRRKPEQRVHPGNDWFYVLDGRVRLYLGEREIDVEAGEAAEFATMTPHALAALGGPADVMMVFSREGQRAHGDGPGKA